VCRARSRREFIAKLGVVIEECDEALFWFEVIVELELVTREAASGLVKEGDEFLAILTAARRTAQRRLT